MPRLDDDFAGIEQAFPDLLPDGAIPISGLVILEYADADGNTEHAVHIAGDSRWSEILGVLESGRFVIYRMMLEEDED